MFLGVEDDFEGELPTEEGGGEGESVKYKYTTYDQQQPSVYMGDKKKGGDGKEIDEYASNVHVCSLVFIMMIFVFGHDILLLLTPTFLFAIFIHLYRWYIRSTNTMKIRYTRTMTSNSLVWTTLMMKKSARNVNKLFSV